MSTARKRGVTSCSATDVDARASIIATAARARRSSASARNQKLNVSADIGAVCATIVGDPRRRRAERSSAVELESNH